MPSGCSASGGLIALGTLRLVHPKCKFVASIPSLTKAAAISLIVIGTVICALGVHFYRVDGAKKRERASTSCRLLDPKDRPDLTKRKAALNWFGVLEEESGNHERIEEEYTKLVKELQGKEAKVPLPLLAKEINFMIEGTKTAYKTITGKEPPPL